MGQKTSISFSHEILQGKLGFFLKPWNKHTTLNPHPEQPIKFQFKTTKKVAENKNLNAINNLKGVKNNFKNTNEINAVKGNSVKRQDSNFFQAKSQSKLTLDKLFGYEIQDVDSFLTKATLDKPANIPVVLAIPSTLYQTRIGGYQTEVSLPLGMVVNAVFKNQHWLYVQTPHAEEGYVNYTACLPLGIIPMQEDDMQSSPCWEKSTDVFPKPSGNMTDTEKISFKSEYDYGLETDTDTTYYTGHSHKSLAFSTCDEKSVDRLYLRATAIAKGKGERHTLLVINEDYKAASKNGISVEKNEVVFLLNVSIQGWFYVKNKEGQEGYIPAVIAGHGFL